MAVNFTTAQGASGDVLIGTTPQAVSDLVMVCTTGWQTSSGNTPAGWTREAGGLYTIQASNTNPLSFDLPSPSPGPAWSAIMLDLLTNGTPTREVDELVDFGTLPETEYNSTISVNYLDAIFWQMSFISTSAPSFTISDSQGNAYGLFQNTQEFGGLYYTSFLAVALGCSAGSTTITFNIANEGSDTSQTSFATNVLTYSGIAPAPPTIFAQVVPDEIMAGQEATVSWVASFAESVTSPQLGGSIALSGSQVVSPTESTGYQFTATGPAATASTQVDLIVTGNSAYFSLQKLILTVKTHPIPERGKGH